MNIGLNQRAHFEQTNRNASLGKLKGGLGSRKASPNDIYCVVFHSRNYTRADL